MQRWLAKCGNKSQVNVWWLFSRKRGLSRVLFGYLYPICVGNLHNEFEHGFMHTWESSKSSGNVRFKNSHFSREMVISSIGCFECTWSRKRIPLWRVFWLMSLINVCVAALYTKLAVVKVIPVGWRTRVLLDDINLGIQIYLTYSLARKVGITIIFYILLNVQLIW